MPFDRVHSLLHDMAALGTEEVWLAGRGEPLVHPKAKEILKLIGDLGMGSIITTNAGRLTEELADELCEWNLRQLSISIDSGTPETYTKIHGGPPEDRARILQLMKHLSKREHDKPNLLVSMVLSQWNFRELLDFVQDAIDHGATGIFVGGMRPVPFDSTDLALSDDDWEAVRSDLAKARELANAAGIDFTTDSIRPVEMSRSQSWPYADMACFIGHIFTVIDVEGVVHGCCTCQNALGSLDEAPFREIWNSRPYQLFRQVLREMPMRGLTPPRCACRHGCGHIPENAHIQQQFMFEFPSTAPPSEFANRAEMAEALCTQLDEILPELERGFDFADIKPEQSEAASRLRQAGIIDTGSMHGGLLFDPHRLVGRQEFEDILTRALLASDIEFDAASHAIVSSRTGSGHPAEPLRKDDMKRWLETIRKGLTDR